MTEPKPYTGGCHCGQVRYRVSADLGRVVECNCSHCHAKGFLLTFVPPGQFELLAGEGALMDYQFNKKIIHHLFCSRCGVQTFARGKDPSGADMVAVNVRSLDGVDAAQLARVPFDGKSI
jgi:hypothetical protein